MPFLSFLLLFLFLVSLRDCSFLSSLSFFPFVFLSFHACIWVADVCMLCLSCSVRWHGIVKSTALSLRHCNVAFPCRSFVTAEFIPYLSRMKNQHGHCRVCCVSTDRIDGFIDKLVWRMRSNFRYLSTVTKNMNVLANSYCCCCARNCFLYGRSAITSISRRRISLPGRCHPRLVVRRSVLLFGGAEGQHMHCKMRCMCIG